MEQQPGLEHRTQVSAEGRPASVPLIQKALSFVVKKLLFYKRNLNIWEPYFPAKIWEPEAVSSWATPQSRFWSLREDTKFEIAFGYSKTRDTN